MTPLGHGALSLVVGSFVRRLPVRALVLGGVLPDIDYALVWAEQFNAWHRVITHNLAFVVGVAAIGAMVTRRRRLAVAAALAVGGLLHMLVDAVLDTNPTNGVGVAILWPLSDAMWSPFNLIAPEPNPAGWADPIAAARGVLRQTAWEVPVWIAAAVVLVRARKRVRARRSV
jgi:membrane-bound metal-dependent hydrolase YbcI (DUF457 family)